MSEAEALDFLFAYDQPHNGTLEEDRHQDVLDSLRAMQEIQRHNGEAGCHRFILSNCAGALDIAILHAMVKASGWEGPMTLDLVPLFESIQDLDGAKAEMAKLYTHPVYAGHLDNVPATKRSCSVFRTAPRTEATSRPIGRFIGPSKA